MKIDFIALDGKISELLEIFGNTVNSFTNTLYKTEK